MNAVATGVLSIGPGQTRVVIEPRRESRRNVVIGVGWEQITRDDFQHAPPNALELENAIARIEEALAPVLSALSGCSGLVSHDPVIREIAAVAGVPDADPVTLDLDAVERVFNRLADVSAGSPSRHQAIPDSPAFAATLLILRELMHHAGVSTIIIPPSGTESAA